MKKKSIFHCWRDSPVVLLLFLTTTLSVLAKPSSNLSRASRISWNLSSGLRTFVKAFRRVSERESRIEEEFPDPSIAEVGLELWACMSTCCLILRRRERGNCQMIITIDRMTELRPEDLLTHSVDSKKERRSWALWSVGCLQTLSRKSWRLRTKTKKATRMRSEWKKKD